MITLDVSFTDGTHSVASGNTHWVEDFITQMAENGKTICSFVFTDKEA